jgi:hypothetical protein
MDPDKDETIRMYKPEAMCKMYVAMIHAVVLMFKALIFSFACACSFNFALKLDQDKANALKVQA